MVQASLRARVIGTTLYCLAFGQLGFALASLGPVLIELAEQMGLDFAIVGYAFPARSLAYLVGSAIGGPFVDRAPGNRILGAGLIASGLGTIGIPFSFHIAILAICVAVQGMSMGFMDTAGNVMIVWLHGEKVAPFMQLLHFSFGVGSLLSPLIIEASRQLLDTFKWAFWGMGISFVIVGLIVIFVKSPTSPHRAEGAIPRKPLTKLEWGLIMYCGTFLFLYVGCEVGMGGYIFTYAVEKMKMTESLADYLTSAYWGSFAVGRLLAVFITIKVSASTMMMSSFIGSAISILLIIIFDDSTTVLWVCVVAYGIFMGPVYPSVMNLAEVHVNLSGKIATIMVICGAAGEMVIPLILASIFQNPDTPWEILMYLVFGNAAFSALVLISFLLVVKHRHRIESRNNNGAIPLHDLGEYGRLQSKDNMSVSLSLNTLKVENADEDDVDYEEDDGNQLK